MCCVGNTSDASTSSDEESDNSEESRYADSVFIKHHSGITQYYSYSKWSLWILMYAWIVSCTVSRVGSSSPVDTEIESLCSGVEAVYSIVTTGYLAH